MVIGKLKLKIIRDKLIHIVLKYKAIKDKYLVVGNLNYLSYNNKIHHIKEIINN